MLEIEAAAISSEPLDHLMMRLGTASAGLRASEARRRLVIYGPNDPTSTKCTPPWLQFLARFRNPLVIILLIASALSAAAGDVTSFVIVVTIIGISTILDFLQEFHANIAVDALRRSVAVRATVRRDGATVSRRAIGAPPRSADGSERSSPGRLSESHSCQGFPSERDAPTPIPHTARGHAGVGSY
jgi:magnesium-transporting ATPase (P-type)